MELRLYHLLRNAVLSLLAKRTIGVRMLLINEGKILLIKHTYQSGWYTIGGGVDAEETPRQAMERELKEEVGVTLTSLPELFSVYYSRNEQRDDYVIFYIGHGCTQEETFCPEISETGWFSLHDLPEDLSPATRRRINEYLGKDQISDIW